MYTKCEKNEGRFASKGRMCVVVISFPFFHEFCHEENGFEIMLFGSGSTFGALGTGCLQLGMDNSKS